MDGYEATTNIRKMGVRAPSETFVPIPIVAMTAAVMGSEIQQCYYVGMNDLVTKPVDIKDLQTKLERYIMHKAVED